MDNLLRLAAIISFVLADLLAFGWIASQNVPHAVGLVAIGLAFWCASTYSPPKKTP